MEEYSQAMGSSESIVITKASSSDLAAMEDICIKTADQGHNPLPERAFPQFLPAIWLTPYMTETRDATCLVAREAAHREHVVGYCISAWDAESFERNLRMAWYPKVRAHYAERMDDFTKADRALWNIMSRPATFSGDWVKRYPAETHIDILSEGRGFGLGRRLIESMEKELQRHGVRGFHLGVDPLNTNAQAFYEHLGLELLVPVSAGGPTYGRVLQE